MGVGGIEDRRRDDEVLRVLVWTINSTSESNTKSKVRFPIQTNSHPLRQQGQHTDSKIKRK